jgi:hypothetical protein
MILVKNARCAAIVVLLVGFALGSACGTVTSTGGGSGAGGGTCAVTAESCSAVVDDGTGQTDTSYGPACCHGSCIVCAPVGADTVGICLDAPYCCPNGQGCHDDATCCSGSCVGQEPSLIGGMIGTCG